jgi:hypothetical protein
MERQISEALSNTPKPLLGELQLETWNLPFKHTIRGYAPQRGVEIWLRGYLSAFDHSCKSCWGVYPLPHSLARWAKDMGSALGDEAGEDFGAVHRVLCIA